MATEFQYFLEGHINEITANTTNSQGLVGIWNRFCQFNIGTYPILEDPSNTFCQKYIVPSAAMTTQINNYTNFLNSSTLPAGFCVIIGFRTPTTVDDTNTKTIYLFDYVTSGFNAYIFFRANSKKIAMRISSIDLVTQTDYDFQPNTDYHIVFKFTAGNCKITINGVDIVTSTNTTSASFGASEPLRMFNGARYASPVPHYPSRFYYLYTMYSGTNYTPTSEYESYLNTPGFKNKFNIPIRTLPNSIPIQSVEHIESVNPKIFAYTYIGQVTFNNVIKYKHPSTTVVQLLDPIAQTVLKTTMTNDDGSFVLRYDTYPKYSQLIAIDYSGEYNTQSLLLKTTS